MDFEKLTDRARGFLQAAQTIAVREHQQRIAPAHLLKAADRVLAVKPEHSQARQARTLAVESLKSEVERLKP